MKHDQTNYHYCYPMSIAFLCDEHYLCDYNYPNLKFQFTWGGSCGIP